jgi:alkylmercury lyase
MTTSAETTAGLKATVEQIWERFRDVGFTPDFGPEGSRLLIALYQRLAAQGTPISPEETLSIADQLGVSAEETESLLAQTSERDDEGVLHGIVGLSLNAHPHQFHVNGHELRNWCALDPLLIVPVMDSDVELVSADPQTGSEVRVSASATGVTSQEPSGAVMSIVVPDAGATDSVEAVWMSFCHQVHFFESRDSAERFFEGRELEVYFVSLDEAFELGRLTMGPMYEQL